MARLRGSSMAALSLTITGSVSGSLGSDLTLTPGWCLLCTLLLLFRSCLSRELEARRASLRSLSLWLCLEVRIFFSSFISDEESHGLNNISEDSEHILTISQLASFTS